VRAIRPEILLTYDLAECVTKGPDIIDPKARSFLAFQMFVEQILAELLGLPPLRWRAHSGQFARVATRSGLQRGVRE
jgi:hypothetical protein